MLDSNSGCYVLACVNSAKKIKSHCPHAACCDDAVLTFSRIFSDIQASGIDAVPPARQRNKQTLTAMLMLMSVKAQWGERERSHDVADRSDSAVTNSGASNHALNHPQIAPGKFRRL